MIIAHEARLDRARSRQVTANPPSALLTQASLPPATQPPSSAPSPVPSEANYASSSVDSSYEERSFDERGDERSGFSDSRGRGGYNGRGGGNNSRGGYNGRGGGRGNNRSVQCQICKKYGHDASICYHRASSTPSIGMSGMNSGYGMQFPNFPMVPMPQFGFSPYCGSPQFGNPTQFGQQQYSGPGSSFPGFPFGPQQFGFHPFAGTPWNNSSSSQFTSVGHRPGNYNARPPQAMITGSSQAGGSSASANLSTWFPDSGATHHVTNDASVVSDSVSLAGHL
ncbi:uncharacterized protein LOC130738069 [Lotus japonicus]|uniref:uncharacterized protein LOC130738069 n=1 Tax=Lotus japonicus TaxID=34305 RepID=UPI002584BB59|nr:uncharacterized protein LOC130738069 [Lotus japonicus]